ncbi:hypothetical protein [Aquimarina sp. AU119]|uniref:hypothetical protein n=1 Tax=Aquimarina sp. AU119 TaxID=2108528 RepID=UPI000D691E52|nr:hypothetical protein [Aquimarina sp. AU119]
MEETLGKELKEVLISDKNQLVQKTKTLKGKVKVLFYSNDTLKNQMLSYDAIVGRLNILEEKAKREVKIETKHSIEYIENKFKILRIISKYNEMSTLIGVYNEYNEAFLDSNESRRAMLIDSGCLFYKDKKELKVYPIENYLENEDELLELVKDKIENNTENDLYFWQGCEMAIPKNSKIILNFNKPYPSVYIKKKEGEDEIFIEENSWHVNYIADKGFLEVIEDQHNSNFLSAIAENEIISVKTNKVSISKKEFANILEENGNLQKSYQAIDMKVLKALKDCEVVVQMPYITPSADMLVKVSFKGSEADELILSTS